MRSWAPTRVKRDSVYAFHAPKWLIFNESQLVWVTWNSIPESLALGKQKSINHEFRSNVRRLFVSQFHFVHIYIYYYYIYINRYRYPQRFAVLPLKDLVKSTVKVRTLSFTLRSLAGNLSRPKAFKFGPGRGQMKQEEHSSSEELLPCYRRPATLAATDFSEGHSPYIYIFPL